MCLKFKWHMFGKDVGELNVTQVEGQSVHDTSVWKRAGNNLDLWHQQYVQLLPSQQPSKVC